jgi:hypothetical protein
MDARKGTSTKMSLFTGLCLLGYLTIGLGCAEWFRRRTIRLGGRVVMEEGSWWWTTALFIPLWPLLMVALLSPATGRR